MADESLEHSAAAGDSTSGGKEEGTTPAAPASSPTSIAAAAGGDRKEVEAKGSAAPSEEGAAVPSPADEGGDSVIGAENSDAASPAAHDQDADASSAHDQPPPPASPETLRALSSQLEYYFSPQNLVRDAFLQSVMARWRPDGRHVPSTVLGNFGNVKKILNSDDVTSNAQLVVEAARLSPLLDVACPAEGEQGQEGVWGVGPRDDGGLDFMMQQQQQQQPMSMPMHAVPVAMPMQMPQHTAAPPPMPPPMMMLPVMHHHQPRHGVAVGVPPGAVLPRAQAQGPPPPPQPPQSPQSRPGQGQQVGAQAQGSPQSQSQPQPQQPPQQSHPPQHHQYPHGMALGVPVPMMMVYHPLGAALQQQQGQMQMMRGYAPFPYFQYAGRPVVPPPPPPPPPAPRAHPHAQAHHHHGQQHNPQHRFHHRRGRSGDGDQHHGGGSNNLGHRNQNHQGHNQNQNQQHPSKGGATKSRSDVNGNTHRERLTVALRDVPAGTTTEEVTGFILDAWVRMRAAEQHGEVEDEGTDDSFDDSGDVKGQSERKQPSAIHGGKGEKIVKQVVVPPYGNCRYVQLDDRVTRDEGNRLVACLGRMTLKGATIRSRLKWDKVINHDHSNDSGKERKNKNKKDFHTNNRSAEKGGGRGEGYQQSQGPSQRPHHPADSDTDGSSVRSVRHKQQQRPHISDGSDSEKSHLTETSYSSNNNNGGGSSVAGGAKATEYSKSPHKSYPHRRSGSRDANVDTRNHHTSSSANMEGGSSVGHKFNAVHQRNHSDGYGTWGKGRKDNNNVASVLPTSFTAKTAAGAPAPPPPPPSIDSSSQFPSLGGTAGAAASAPKLKHEDHPSPNKRTERQNSASPAIYGTGNNSDLSIPVAEQVKQIGGYAAALLGKKEKEGASVEESTDGKKTRDLTSAEPKLFLEGSELNKADHDSAPIESSESGERTAKPKETSSSETKVQEVLQTDNSPPQQVQSKVETNAGAEEQRHNMTKLKETHKSLEQLSCSNAGVVSCSKVEDQSTSNMNPKVISLEKSDAPGTPVAGPKTDQLRHASPKTSTVNPLPLNSPAPKADDICTNDTKSTDSFSSLSAGGHYTCSPSSSSIASLTTSTSIKGSSGSGVVSSTPISTVEKTTNSPMSSPPSAWGKKATFADIVKSK